MLHPVRSGALAFGGGLAVGCTERGPPPHSHGVRNRENGGEARGIEMSPDLFFISASAHLVC